MKSYKLIHQLLSLVEQLEIENNGAEVSMADFAGFMANQVDLFSSDTAKQDIRFGKNETTALDIANQLDNNISQLFLYMSRYAKSYIKKALEGTPLQSAEEFTGLAILLTHDHLSKSGLITYNLQEKASGTEVIRRLISAGLIHQWDNLKDKRGKYIGITEKGKKLLYNVFIDMNHVGKMITGKLTFSEKLTLQYLLQKLENFHFELYENKTIITKSDLQNYSDENK